MQTNPFFRHPIVIAGGVILLHVGGLVALHSGLLVRAYEMVVPAEMISQIIEPPEPEIAPPPPPSVRPAPPERVKQAVLPPAPQPLAVTDPIPAPNAPEVTPAPPAPPPPAPVSLTTTSPPTAPTTATRPANVSTNRVAIPPAMAYQAPFEQPRLSNQREEYGTAVLSIMISSSGTPIHAEVAKSSGFALLDRAFVMTALKSKYKPATCDGKPVKVKVRQPFTNLPTEQAPSPNDSNSTHDCNQLPPQD